MVVGEFYHLFLLNISIQHLKWKYPLDVPIEVSYPLNSHSHRTIDYDLDPTVQSILLKSEPIQEDSYRPAILLSFALAEMTFNLICK
jgi:hypothetical protein